MMVTFVSQCEKKALNKTRRVLDAFANRIGDNTWQTVITQEGLVAVKKLLRKTATKNTAISCHWIRSRARSDLVWVIGKRDKFDAQGNVPVNWTRRNLLSSTVENDWHYLPLIKALVALSALLHDWGKATELFQFKLDISNQPNFKGDPIRHEWMSCLLLHTFIHSHSDDNESDRGWLTALVSGEINEAHLKTINATTAQQKPLHELPPIAKLIAWLIVSHHRLPLPNGKPNDLKNKYQTELADSMHKALKLITREWGYENKRDEDDYQTRLAQCFRFPHGLISDSLPWLQQVRKWAARLLACEDQAKQTLNDGSYRVLLHHSRLCLMLGDHYYSSQEKSGDKVWQNSTGLYANTDRKTGSLKQKLDEHLVGVAKNALKTSHLLPFFEKEPPLAHDISSLKKLSPRTFRWQDKAVEKIKAWRVEGDNDKLSANQYGFFAVNMASTGCGKTFANAKVMRALSPDSSSLRYVLALGLRTLTLQTGDEYRKRIGLDNSELAVLIGSKAVMELHQQAQLDEAKNSFENCGSLSEETLLDEDVDYECALPEDNLSTVLTCDRDRKFLYAPVLACTIDHIMAATETKRGGRYILPCLRLMSSDLVIDEIDDFTGDDLIAIGRLIHLSGMLGRKVMISSATIPPDLAEGYFKAYRDGWQLYCKTRSASKNIGCAWIDEFSTQVSTNSNEKLCDAISTYRAEHEKFVTRRVNKLEEQTARRKADISSCQFLVDNDDVKLQDDMSSLETKQDAYFDVIANSAMVKHGYHNIIDTCTGLSVSFGVVRMANISPCVALGKYLLQREWPKDTEVRVMVYHSQQTLLLRNVQEQHLDQVLKRKESLGEQPQALSNAIIRGHLDTIHKEQPSVKNIIFILVATPVEEVGRDHDFDWAVVEPSSYRSIIQLAGRVRRHRSGEVENPNVTLLQYNWRAIKNTKNKGKVFIRPGFEEYFQLNTHNVSELVDPKALANRLDGTPRIKKPSHINAKFCSALVGRTSSEVPKTLAELEHVDTWRLLASYKNKGPQSLQGYLNEAWFLTALPQKLTPFRKGEPTLKVFLHWQNDNDKCSFVEKDERGHPTGSRERVLGIEHIDLTECETTRLWLRRSFEGEVKKMSENMELSLQKISLRYGELSFRHLENGAYEYSDQFGLVKIEGR